MANVFISYAAEDERWARTLAESLRAAGHTVWWDEHIAAGEAWRDSIDRELAAARAIVVLWSAASVRSHHVLDEAAVGRDHGKLVPICIDGSEPPLGFRGIQTAAWDGNASHPTVQVVVDRVRALDTLGGGGAPWALGGAAPPAPAGLGRNGAPRRPAKRWVPLAIGAGLLAAGVIGTVVLASPSGPKPIQEPTAEPSAASVTSTASASATPPAASGTSAPDSTWQRPFIRERPGCPPHIGVDACAYLGCLGFACSRAIVDEVDPVKRQYMRRLSDAEARLVRDNLSRVADDGVAHAEISMMCKDSGPCDEGGEGLACLTKAQLELRDGNLAAADKAHARACRCGAKEAQIPVMGGTMACDGVNRPVKRGENLSLDEALDARACGECDADKGLKACQREVERLSPRSPLVADFIESVHVPRCQQKSPPGEWAPYGEFEEGRRVLVGGRVYECIEGHAQQSDPPARAPRYWREIE